MSTTDWQYLVDTAYLAARRAAEVLRLTFRSSELVVERKEDGTPVTRADVLAEQAIRGVLREKTPELGILGEEMGPEGPSERRWVIDPIDGTKSFIRGLPYVASLIGLELEGRSVLGLVHAPFLTRVGRLGAAREPGVTWWAYRGGGAWCGEGPHVEAEALAVSGVQRLEQATVAHGGLKHFQESGQWDAITSLVADAARTRGFGDFWGHMLVAEGRCDAMLDPRVGLHDIVALEPILAEAGGRLVVRGKRAALEGATSSVLGSNAALADTLAERLGYDGKGREGASTQGPQRRLPAERQRRARARQTSM